MPDPITLLPGNRTPWETAQSLTSAERHPLDVGILAAMWDPWRCLASRLPSLAADLSVDLWDESWSEEKKRSVIAASPVLHRLKGTQEGIRRHMAIMDATLIEALAPPQRFYATRDLTKDEWEGWLDRLPQIRVYFGSDFGNADHGFFAGDGAAGVDFAQPDEGPALYGRRATLRRNGVETSIRMIDRYTNIEIKPAVDIEVFRIPGEAPDAFFAQSGEDAVSFAGHSFAGAEKIKPVVYTVRFDRTYVDRQTTIRPSVIDPGFDPIDVFSVRQSTIGDASLEFHAGDQAGHHYAGPNRAPWMLHDRLYLNDSDVLAPVTEALSFAGVSRVGMRPFTAEILGRAPAPLPEDAWPAGVGVASISFAFTPDLSGIYRAMDAVEVSKAHRDSIAITFAETRARRITDGIPLDGSFSFGDRVANHL